MVAQHGEHRKLRHNRIPHGVRRNHKRGHRMLDGLEGNNLNRPPLKIKVGRQKQSLIHGDNPRVRIGAIHRKHRSSNLHLAVGINHNSNNPHQVGGISSSDNLHNLRGDNRQTLTVGATMVALMAVAPPLLLFRLRHHNQHHRFRRHRWRQRNLIINITHLIFALS